MSGVAGRAAFDPPSAAIRSASTLCSPLSLDAAFLSPVLRWNLLSVRTFFKHLCFPLQYILSGSDDFNLYMWKIPKDPEAGELCSEG